MESITYDIGAGRDALVVRNNYDRPLVIAVCLAQKMLGRTGETALNRSIAVTRPALQFRFLWEHLITKAPFCCLKVPGEAQNQIGLTIAGGATVGYHCDLVALAEIAQRRMRRFGDTLDIWTHFTPGVEKQNHVQRIFLVAEVQDCLWLSLIRHSKTFPSETRYYATVLTNLSVHMDQRDVAPEGRLVLCDY